MGPEVLEQIIATADGNLRQLVPHGCLIKFAVTTAMMQRTVDATVRDATSI